MPGQEPESIKKERRFLFGAGLITFLGGIATEVISWLPDFPNDQATIFHAVGAAIIGASVPMFVAGDKPPHDQQ